MGKIVLHNSRKCCITNGNEFRFIKLTKQDTPRYALSYTLSLNRGDDLHTVVKVLKRLAHLIRNS